MASGDVNQTHRFYSGAAITADANSSVIRLGARRRAQISLVWTTSDWVGDLIILGSNSADSVADGSAVWENAWLHPGISRAVYSVSGASGSYTFSPPHGWDYTRLKLFIDDGTGTITTITGDVTVKDN